ncbi:MAG TPA: BON domain-containing protein [Acidobacteriota bacterium]|nr:BON domain-containing protein [Acidobacteriota bacterium]
MGCSKPGSASESAKEAAKDAGNAINEAAKKASEETKEATKKMGEIASDASITAKIKMKFASDEKVSAMNVGVDTKDGMVTLTGEVASKEERERAVELAKSVEGVKMVHSNLKIKKK